MFMKSVRIYLFVLCFRFLFSKFLVILSKIVIGGWQNTRTLIRKQRNKFDMVDLVTPNVLSATVPREVDIHIRTGIFHTNHIH